MLGLSVVKLYLKRWVKFTDARKGSSLYQILLQSHMQVKRCDFYIVAERAYSGVSMTRNLCQITVITSEVHLYFQMSLFPRISVLSMHSSHDHARGSIALAAKQTIFYLFMQFIVYNSPCAGAFV